MCMHCKGMSRRGFLEVVSAGAAAAAPMMNTVLAAPAATTFAAPVKPKTKVRVAKIYLAQPHAGWPKPNLDVAGDVKRYEEEFAKLKPQLEDIEFVGGDLVTNAQQLAEAKAKFKDVAGILAIHINMGIGGYLNSLLEMNLPVVLFAMPYAGHEWHTIAALQRQGKKLEMFPTSSYADLVAAVRPFRAIGRLKEAKVLFIQDGGPNPKYVKMIKDKFGTEIKNVPSQELVAAYQSIPLAEATAHAERWIKGAEKVVEPTKEDIVKGARMDLALFKLVEREAASVITINCLGMGLIEKNMGYPCLGFCRLNDVGLGGVCEADLKSTMTHLIFLNLVGKPGFVTDPVIDLSTNTIIHAHCVSATKMEGVDGPSSPYVIRNHLEDHRGCVLQVKLPVGKKMTMARLIDDNLMLFSTGEITGIPDVDRGCRTKIATKVQDAKRILENWSCGLHRVVFFGDHTQDLQRFCRFKDIRILNEETEDLRNVPGLEWNPNVHA